MVVNARALFLPLLNVPNHAEVRQMHRGLTNEAEE
jgi:hypothetical protein